MYVLTRKPENRKKKWINKIQNRHLTELFKMSNEYFQQLKVYYRSEILYVYRFLYFDFYN